MKIAILGSGGFLGSNLLEDLSQYFECVAFSRKQAFAQASKNHVTFDICDPNTWTNLIDFQADCIINCIAYGVVRTEVDVQQMIDINYLHTIRLYNALAEGVPDSYLIHIGTAFEYNLDEVMLSEEKTCVPKTYYGISKYLASNYLVEGTKLNHYTIIRPFNMFGPYEDTSKIIPGLIKAQQQKLPLLLSDGLQKRDYFFVKDLSSLIKNLIEKSSLRKHRVINAGSGKAIALRSLAELLSTHIPDFKKELWEWDKVSHREGENSIFYNESQLAFDCGMTLTALDLALKKTVNHYWNV